MPLLTMDDLRRHRGTSWLCLAVLTAVAASLWLEDKRSAALGTLAAVAGCLGLLLPPRERMPALPWRIRALPRSLDVVAPLATLLTSPGYGLNWFYGANPYDEVVHLLNGILLGLVFLALFEVDGTRRGAGRRAGIGLAFGLALGGLWEVFEWTTGLIGNWTDTWTDMALTTAGAVIGALLAGPVVLRAVVRREARYGVPDMPSWPRPADRPAG